MFCKAHKSCMIRTEGQKRTLMEILYFHLLHWLLMLKFCRVVQFTNLMNIFFWKHYTCPFLWALHLPTSKYTINIFHFPLLNGEARRAKVYQKVKRRDSLHNCWNSGGGMIMDKKYCFSGGGARPFFLRSMNINKK